MADTNKTKADLLQELESIKGLLVEHDGIPILHDTEPLPVPGAIDIGHASAELSAQTHQPSVAQHSTAPAPSQPVQRERFDSTRPIPKAQGENPFLPQHIRERLHGNNPPPLLEFEIKTPSKSPVSVFNNTYSLQDYQLNPARKHLIDSVIRSLMPQVEMELRHRLVAMNAQELERLLTNDDS